MKRLCAKSLHKPKIFIYDIPLPKMVLGYDIG